MSESKIRSRRALLVGAAGGAAAVAASAALPVSRALAVDQPLLLNVPNSATAPTALSATLASNTGAVLYVSNLDNGVQAQGLGGAAPNGIGVTGNSTNGTGVRGEAAAVGVGVRGLSGAAGTGVHGLTGDPLGAPSDTSLTGVFGHAEGGDGVNTFGAGVWGDSDDFGVYGTGSIGVYGSGGSGVIGDGGSSGTGLEGYSGSGYGLYVTGKVKLANRSGRLAVGAGKTSIAKSVPGLAASNIVIAVLQTAETGTWVRAAVASTGKFTVYFNKALPTSSVVGWIVLN